MDTHLFSWLEDDCDDGTFSTTIQHLAHISFYMYCRMDEQVWPTNQIMMRSSTKITELQI